MNAAELVRSGDLDAALTELRTEVRRAPADPKHRVFLFQLHTLRGEWDKAIAQLDVLGELDKEMALLVTTCRTLVRAEKHRESIFAGKEPAVPFGEPRDWTVWLIEALRLEANGQAAEAAALREKAFDAAPASTGKVDGAAFAWIADADGRFGPLLEAIVNGRYVWVPFDRVLKITIDEPVDLRDLVWAPARFTWLNEGETAGFIPARYPGSQQAGHGFALGRQTDWRGEAPVVGIGQRVLATDEADHPLLQIRQIDIAQAPVASAPIAAASAGSAGA